MTPERYRTIVADPPWAYRVCSGIQGAIGTQYNTLSNEALAALSVGALAADDAHLYLWVTNPRLFAEPHDACGPIDILRTWGFEYKTTLTWVKKPGLGLGFYFRGDTEHVLFGTRGSASIEPPLRESNVVTAPRSGHSSKPDAFYDLVERVFPRASARNLRSPRTVRLGVRRRRLAGHGRDPRASSARRHRS